MDENKVEVTLTPETLDVQMELLLKLAHNQGEQAALLYVSKALDNRTKTLSAEFSVLHGRLKRLQEKTGEDSKGSRSATDDARPVLRTGEDTQDDDGAAGTS